MSKAITCILLLLLLTFIHSSKISGDKVENQHLQILSLENDKIADNPKSIFLQKKEEANSIEEQIESNLSDFLMEEEQIIEQQRNEEIDRYLREAREKELREQKALILESIYKSVNMSDYYEDIAKGVNLIYISITNYQKLREIESFAEAIKINTKINELVFENNVLDDETVKIIIDGIKDNKSITKLVFNKNNISDEGIKYISELLKLKTKIVSIAITNNKLSDTAMQYLSEALKENQTLTYSLDLNNDQISDIGIKFLSEAIKLNHTLIYMSLGYNNYTDKGVLYIIDAMKINNTIISIYTQSTNKDSELYKRVIKLAEANKMKNVYPEYYKEIKEKI